MSVNQQRVEQEVQRQACFIVGTNQLDPAQLSAEELVSTYKDQGGVERGFRFLKDPLFLASSVFLKVRSVCSKLAASCNEGMSSSRMADNWRSDVGCNSQPSRRRRKSIAPSVATGHQSEKRGEKREKRQASCGPPASRLPW